MPLVVFIIAKNVVSVSRVLMEAELEGGLHAKRTVFGALAFACTRPQATPGAEFRDLR